MYYVVIDFEWNQYHNPLWTPTNRNGVIMHEEIIQIGAVKTEHDMTPVDTFNVFVRLGGRRRLDRYVKKLTGINESMLLSGEDFPMAAEMFGEWISDVDAIFSWGQDDRRVFLNNLAYHNLEAPTCAWYDAQKLYARQNPQHGGMALKNIADEAGIRVNLGLHNAMNDAILTSACMSKLDLEEGIREYDAPVKLPASGLPKPISTARTHRHNSAEAAWDEACASLMHCPRCMQAMSWLDGEKGDMERWYKTAQCPDHGKFIVRGEFLGVKVKTLKLSFFEDSLELESAIDKELGIAPPAAKKTRRRRRGGKKKQDAVAAVSPVEMLPKAIAYAANKHAEQLLLPGTSPYIVHPMEVCQILSTMTDDSALLSAAMLHDVLNLCPDVSAEELRSEFGDHVCALVEGMNEVGKDSDSEQLMLKLSDMLSGLRNVKRQSEKAGEDFWKDMGEEQKNELRENCLKHEKLFAPLGNAAALTEYKKLVSSLFKPKRKAGKRKTAAPEEGNAD